MPSNRSRSRSRDSRERSKSPEVHLPGGAEPISDSDYFAKSVEFRVWLKDEKRKYFDELTGEKARKYFHKFVKAWNKGKLPKSLYAGVDPSSQPATSQTKYKWSFASNRSKVDNSALEAARAAVSAATYGASRSSTGASGSGRVQGPTLPSSADRILAREAADEYSAAERSYQRKKERAEAKERVEDMVGPREVGRERMLEKKRERREGDRAFREKGEDGLEADEGTLLGGGGSFQEAIARRDAARARFEQKRGVGRQDKMSETQERASAIRAKDKATMDMFMQMAKQKFG
ncbi:hypothetical protein BV25DRAFT_1868232 [Artomyces pyxidatus]|uniref:Uncharacterized protein n=1 Tax=Artomyces pyxidatus TaxID=48021 RepID=A0ACB8TDR5_9AGAM|nr:hypothetical protein BV25DRAFT_1868232 [Artomyces pyxidatus]